MYGHYLFISTLLALGARAHNGGHKEGGKQHLSFKHVAVFSVDGLHNSDIDKYLTKGKSNISMMLDNGYRYTNAYSTFPSDSFPGTLALFTGAFPVQSGVWYDDVWDRSLYPPGSKCSGAAGAEVVLDESLDKNSSLLFSGGIDPTLLPLGKVGSQCVPIYPHMRIRVNTAFEVVVGAGFKTAYADKHPAYDLVRGPSGKGLTVGYFPEINNADSPTDSVAKCVGYDQLHVNAWLNWMTGTTPANSEGALNGDVPTLWGGNFQSVSVGQKTKGYTPGSLDFSPDLLTAMKFVDSSLGAIINGLKAKNLYQSTLIFICSKHGQSPIDPTAFKKVDPALVEAQLGVPHNHTTFDNVGLVFLSNQNDLAKAVANLQKNMTTLRIQEIIYGQDQINKGFGDPKKDAAVPDIIIQPIPGTIYTTSSKKVAEHGGGTQDDRHVACFAHNPQLKKQTFDHHVDTTDVAPSILKALGMDPEKLQGKARQLPGF